MTVAWQEELRPGVALREIVEQATAALVAMDAERLEELARCCAYLNREIDQRGRSAEAVIALRGAENGVKLLGRVLYETRANLTVLTRLHAIRLRESMAASSQIGSGCSLTRRESAALPVLTWTEKTTEKAAEYGDN